MLLPGGLTGWDSWLRLMPALSARREVVRVQPISNAEGLAGRPGDPDTDFEALPHWEFWSSCRQALSWGGEKMTTSAVAGTEGFERLDVPTLLIRGRSTAPWLTAVVDLLAAGMPDASVVDLDGGHACLLESAEDFVAALGAHSGGIVA